MILGLYRHYKGELYLVQAVAQHTETLEEMVVYRSLYGDFVTWVRPLSMFESTIEHEGKIVRRFTYIRDPSAEPTTIIG